MRQLENSAQIFNALSDVPGDVQDVDELINVRLLNITMNFSHFVHVL